MLLLSYSIASFGQAASLVQKNDSTSTIALEQYEMKLLEIEQRMVADSIRKIELELQLLKLQTTDNLQKEDLLKQQKTNQANDINRVASLCDVS